MTSLQIEKSKLEESRRHNIATESENVRHNVVSEDIGYLTTANSTAVGMANVALGYENVDLGWSELIEKGRHNIETETEAIRHNKRTEAIDKDRIELGYDQLDESVRHNQAGEVIGRTQAATGFANGVTDAGTSGLKLFGLIK